MAMAPALTDPAPQARAETSTTPTCSQASHVNGRNGIKPSVSTNIASAAKDSQKGVVGSSSFISMPHNITQGARTSKGPITTSIIKTSSVNPTRRHLLTLNPQQITLLQTKPLTRVSSEGSIARVMNNPSSSQGTSQSNGVVGTSQPSFVPLVQLPTMGFSKTPPPQSTVSFTSTDDQVLDGTVTVDDSGLDVVEESHQAGGHCEPQSSGMAEVGVLNNKDLIEETSKRQVELERRLERLTRRMRKVQSRQAVAHTQQQLSSFVSNQHGNLQRLAVQSIQTPTSEIRGGSGFPQKEDMRNLSTSALVSLVRRLQTSQAALSLRQRLSTSISSPSSSQSIIKLDENLCQEMSRVSGTLTSNLRHLSTQIDSDATESSSGGESCDEDYDLTDDKARQQPLSERCEWQYCADRAGVASRWTWLQAQVSDLEYRIRQQTEIYRQIRAAKGSVTLGDQPPPHDFMARPATTVARAASTAGRKLTPLEEKIATLERKNIEISPCNLTQLLSNVNQQSSRLTQSLGNVYSPANSPAVHPNHSLNGGRVPNGLIDGSSVPATPNGSDTESAEESKKYQTPAGPSGIRFHPPSPPQPDTSFVAARCRPVKSYGKRKLLRTAGLHLVSRKAARLSTVRCTCHPPATSCALCGGRYNNTQALDTHWSSLTERAALLDHAYHTTLSFKEDIPLPLHFESLLKTGDWRQKAQPRITLKSSPPSLPPPPRHVTRKYNKRLKTAVASRIKNKYDSKTSSRVLSTAAPKMPETTRGKRSNRKKRGNHVADDDDMDSWDRWGMSSRDTTSPLNQSSTGSSLRELKEAQRRKNNQDNYDINNIVIPYSMAASTRVEKLQYKEIKVPNWRELTRDELAASVAASAQSSSQPSTSQTQTYTQGNLLCNPQPHMPEVASAGQKDIPASPAGGEPEVKKEPGYRECIISAGGDALIKSESDDSELEDIRDEIFEARHERCAEAERKKFSAAITHKRTGRGQRSDSNPSAAAGGSSSLAGDSGIPDFDTLVASIGTPPGTPDPLLIDNTASQRSRDIGAGGDAFLGIRSRADSASSQGSCRNRTNSISSQASDRHRSSSASWQTRERSISAGERTEEIIEYRSVSPWPLRTFPLNDEQYNHISTDSADPPPPRRRKTEKDSSTSKPTTPAPSRTASPCPSTSSDDACEDPDDPEWTVEQEPRDRTPSLVLKLTKR